MNERFIVETQKTAETIKDFILFKRRAMNSHSTFHFTVLGVGMMFMGYSTLAEDAAAGRNFILIGAILLFLALFRHHLTVSKFKKSDQAYQEQWKLKYLFTNNEMYVYKNDELFQSVGNFHNISSFYGDEKNLYLGINNEEMYVLPKCDFTLGIPEDFIAFISSKSNQNCIYSPATPVNRIRKLLSK